MAIEYNFSVIVDMNISTKDFRKYCEIFLILLSLVLSGFALANQTNLYQQLEQYKIEGELLPDDGFIGIPVEINTYAKPKTDLDMPIVLYIINHSMDRIGQEDDLSIINDFLQDGFIVVIVDYKNHSLAVSPGIDWSIQQIRIEVNKGKFLSGLSYNPNFNYVLPAGYRLKRDIIFWSIDKHATKGTLEYIVDVYNKHIVPKYREKYNLKEAQNINDCVKPDGSALDMDLRLDIIYPSKPNKKVPVFMLAASSETRNKSTLNPIRPHHTGFLMRGYAGVCYDHEYIPMARDDHYGYFNPYGLAGQNGIKAHTAAVRYVRVLAGRFRYDADKISVWGHSKSAYCAILSNPNPESIPESSSFAGFPNETYGEQPWLRYPNGKDVPGNVQVCYSSMGGGLSRHLNYLTEDSSPAVLACGRLDQYGAWDWWGKVKQIYADKDVPHLAIGMLELGHAYPYKYDEILGFDRYAACFDFFDYYLKGAKPKIIYSTPLDGSELMVGEDSLIIKFNAPIPKDSIIQNCIITHLDTGNEIKGDWTASCGNTEWAWSSDQSAEMHDYKLVVDAGLVDIKHQRLDEGLSKVFTAAILDDDPNKIYNVAQGKLVRSNQANYVPEYSRLTDLVDGVTGGRYISRWVHNNNYAASNPRPTWVEIDFQGSFEIFSAEIYSGSDGKAGKLYEQIVNYQLEYHDGNQWLPIKGAAVQDNDTNYNKLEFTNPIITDKIRLYTDDEETKIFTLKEIEIYGKRLTGH